jgi:Ca2+:H+ antiporter
MFEGNKAETSTLIPVLTAFAQRHAIAGLVVVADADADAGMLSGANLNAIEDAGFCFIVGSRLVKAPYDLAEHFTRHGNYFTDGQILESARQMGTGKNARSRRVIYQWKFKRQKHDDRTINLMIAKAEKIASGKAALRKARFLKVTGATKELDQVTIDRARQLAGLKGYVTNLSVEQMPGQGVIDAYHDLWQVERSFRMTKSDLRARPVFHHQREAIEAHLTVVFAALAVARHLQDATGVTLKKLAQTLRPLRSVVIAIGDQTIPADPTPGPEARAILDQLPPITLGHYACESQVRERTVVAPLFGLLVLALAWGRDLPVLVAAGVAAVLAAAVLAAVHHAEVVALRVGEPFGSLVLAVAVTVIEVSLIITLMTTADSGKAETLARDTVFAAVMITCNGIVGISLLLGARRHGIVPFNAEGSGAALSAVTTLATLCLVLPAFTTSEPGPRYTGQQLTFAASASLLLYLLFVLTQTVRHRDFFLPVRVGPGPDDGPDHGPDHAPDEDAPDEDAPDEDAHAAPPTDTEALVALGLLVACLVAVVGLAKVESPSIERGVAAVGFPPSFVGVVIALLVLLPETLAAGRAALHNRVQTSLNLAYGSALATIGLTIPSIAVASIWLAGPLTLGLGPLQIVLLGLTVVVSVLAVVPGRATRLQGGLHLVLLVGYLVLAVQP